MFLRLFGFVAFLSFFSLAHAQGAYLPISNCHDLKRISKDLTAYYYLTSHINCADDKANPFHPIDGTFTGTLDGQGFRVLNISIVNQDGRKSENTGIFRALGNDSVIKNISFVNSRLTAHTDAHRGIIAGVATGKVNISNVNFDNLEILRHDVAHDKKKDLGGTGAVVGLAKDGTITIEQVRAVNHILLNQNAFAGGLIGIASGNTIINQSSVSGLQAKGSKTCYNPANECGFGGLIGLIGHFEPHNKGNPPDNHVPGLENGKSVIISESSTAGTIFSDKNLGGLVGMIKANRGVVIENSYSQLNLTCKNDLGDCKYGGGLIGKAKEDLYQKPIMLNNVYAAGSVYDVYFMNGGMAGGIVGAEKDHSITRIFSSLNMNSYYDKNATGMKVSGDKTSKALTTQEMKSGKTSSFETWDSSIWMFDLGYYPELINN